MKASSFITEVEYGEHLVISRRGKPIAKVIPFSEESMKKPY